MSLNFVKVKIQLIPTKSLWLHWQTTVIYVNALYMPDLEMTRFAKFGEKTRKAEEASTWKELKSGAGAQSDLTPPKAIHSPAKQQHDKLSSPLKGVKKDKQFKAGKGKHGNNDKKKSFLNKPKFNSKKPLDYSSLECYNCKQKGHKASDCPQPPDGKKLEFQCYNCKEKGHKSFECPKPSKRDGKKFAMKKRGNEPEKNKSFKFNKTDKDWKEKRSEQRRVKRQSEAETKKHCFHCREAGHQMSECPDMQKDVEHGTGICFKCGSTEHAINKCPVKLSPGEFPYAKCFICGEIGHLSRQCPDNPRGLYPNGGCCNECGSVEHLRRDCPEFQKKQGIESITLGRLEDSTSLEDQPSQEPSKDTTIKQKTKKPKLVKF
ncbi:uncharacterized protein LOC128227673 isoform X1 [Mya arenaria]|uniref:uncharacterized protein LOC128227673 isoform X1 n=2 Tax=Mya arenaria TaxID=6604 RepID=UPI0022E80792|nr:uncharacterized protein LOC128227673 isoform X1 [Mya arenaria]